MLTHRFHCFESPSQAPSTTLVSLFLLASLLTSDNLGKRSCSTVDAFASRVSHLPFLPANSKSTTVLDAKKKGKPSFAERRKRRGKRLPPRPVDRPSILDETAPVDQWDRAPTTDEAVRQMKSDEDDAKARAAALIETQRKSVDTLTHVRRQVESLPYEDLAEALSEGGCYVSDGFLGEEIVSEVELEALSMLEGDKLELDVTYIGSGEYGAEIKGGEDQYADCPRSVEFVVSLTRHMPPLLNEVNAMEGKCRIDEAASMGSVRAYDRKARASSLELLTGKSSGQENDADEGERVPTPERPFGYANGGDEDDARQATVIYYATPSGWDADCGGGVTVQKKLEKDSGNEGTLFAAKRDRLLVFRSDKCFHRMEAWHGREGLDNGSCIVIHLVEKAAE